MTRWSGFRVGVEFSNSSYREAIKFGAGTYIYTPFTPLFLF